LKSSQVYLYAAEYPLWPPRPFDEMRTLLILGTALTAGAIAIALAAVVAWLRRPPR